ncbi:MAG: hypothetical protein LBT00_16385, partial [Spirochaetaceae bacterium]|nr:hypothetical protein [Spirochaetaceae bacterium]
ATRTLSPPPPSGLLRRLAPRNDNGSPVIASGAKQSRKQRETFARLLRLDCFAALRLAMTIPASLRASPLVIASGAKQSRRQREAFARLPRLGCFAALRLAMTIPRIIASIKKPLS